MGESLRDLRSGDDARKNWREINKHGDAIFELQRQVAALRTGRYPELRQAGGEGGTVHRYELVSVDNDHLFCAEPGGASFVLIAKPFNLRRTPWDGQTITYTDEQGLQFAVTYTYSSPIKRIARIGAFSETQVVVPRYIPGCLIFASTVDNGTGLAAIEAVDINADARAWARQR